jgi:uncharacterized membrane protein
LQEKYEHEMERRNGVGMIGGTPLLMGRSCMLVVMERLANGEIITIFILYFDVLFKYTLYLLNIEGTRCSTG